MFRHAFWKVTQLTALMKKMAKIVLVLGKMQLSFTSNASPRVDLPLRSANVEQQAGLSAVKMMKMRTAMNLTAKMPPRTVPTMMKVKRTNFTVSIMMEIVFTVVITLKVTLSLTSSSEMGNVTKKDFSSTSLAKNVAI